MDLSALTRLHHKLFALVSLQEFRSSLYSKNRKQLFKTKKKSSKFIKSPNLQTHRKLLENCIHLVFRSNPQLQSARHLSPVQHTSVRPCAGPQRSLQTLCGIMAAHKQVYISNDTEFTRLILPGLVFYSPAASCCVNKAVKVKVKTFHHKTLHNFSTCSK